MGGGTERDGRDEAGALRGSGGWFPGRRAGWSGDDDRRRQRGGARTDAHAAAGGGGVHRLRRGGRSWKRCGSGWPSSGSRRAAFAGRTSPGAIGHAPGVSLRGEGWTRPRPVGRSSCRSPSTARCSTRSRRTSGSRMALRWASGGPRRPWHGGAHWRPAGGGAAGPRVRRGGIATASDPALGVASVYGALRTSLRTRISAAVGAVRATARGVARRAAGHFLLSPTRRPGRRVYGAGGVAVVGGPVEQGYLVVTLGLEAAPGGALGMVRRGRRGRRCAAGGGLRWRRLPAGGRALNDKRPGAGNAPGRSS